MLVKLLLGFAVALFLTYPASILTTVIEGQSAVAIYSYHLPTSLFAYFLVCLPVLFIFRHTATSGVHLNLPLLLIISVYSILVFWNLGRADIVGDDYDLAYQAYNLQDGIQAARKALVISYNTHPPLFMSIKHYWFQILFPNGLETVPSWGYRGMEGLVGIATIVTVYVLTRNLWAPAILAVNNYMIMMGRVYLREMYLTFFVTLSIYFFQKQKYLITAFLVGCGLLVKTSAIVILPVYLLILIVKKDVRSVFKILLVLFAMYIPVLGYNLLAYITTGHMDATFSKIFGLTHPFLTGPASPLDNLINSIIYLKDIYSFPVLILFTTSAFVYFRSIYLLILLSSLLYFIFGGPLREYYLLFITVPFAILSSKLPKLIVLTLIIFSVLYSVTDNSSIRKIYEPVAGWPTAVAEIKAAYKPGDCLEKTGGVNDLAMRAYFQTDDTPKKILLGPNYPHYYKMCEETEAPLHRINIFYNKVKQVTYRVI